MLGGKVIKRRPPYSGLTYKHDLLTENLPIGCNDNIAEIGVGTGYSCFKLSAATAGVFGFDISQDLIETLNASAEPYGNLEFVQTAVSLGVPSEKYCARMDLVFSIDTLNYIAPPESFFVFIEKLLKSGGRAMVGFPNETDEKNEGITNFENAASLRKAIAAGNLVCDAILPCDYTSWFHFVNRNLWYRVKKVFYRDHYDGKTNPQVFNNTVAFKLIKNGGVSSLVRIYSAFIMTLLRMGRVYKYEDTSDIYGRYLVLKLHKPG